MQISPKFQGVYVRQAEYKEMGTSSGTEIKIVLTDDDQGNNKSDAEKVLGAFDGEISVSQSSGCFGGSDSVYVSGATDIKEKGFGRQQFTTEQKDYLTNLFEGISAIEPSVRDTAKYIISRQAKA